uniref:Profilin n=1 Tax=Syphacia muris TaxID=451379 RepID=A0A0N5AVX9_9BILA
MSGWSAYITNLLQASKSMKRACICGLDGVVWARSEGANEFKGTEAELKKFIALFDKIHEVPGKGCELEGIHYIVPRTEENLIFGKKDRTGLFASKTKTAVVIACYEGENAAEVRVAVEKLAQYLNEAGY